MKNFILVVFILFIAHLAWAGPRVVRNGGDLYAIEFLGIGQQVLKSLQSHPDADTISLKKLANSLDKTLVESTSRPLYLNGVQKDAINYPAQMHILLYRLSWAAQSDLAEKATLVLHEYLGISGIDDTNYSVSTPLITKIGYGKVTYNGQVFDRSLSPTEQTKLLPLYLSFIERHAKDAPSPLDREALRQIDMPAQGPTRVVSNSNHVGGLEAYDIVSIKNWLQSSLSDLLSITESARSESTLALVEGFRSSSTKVTCEFGYNSVIRLKTERLVKCVDNRSVSLTSKEDEGFTDERTIILSVDPQSLEPLGIVSLDILRAG